MRKFRNRRRRQRFDRTRRLVRELNIQFFAYLQSRHSSLDFYNSNFQYFSDSVGFEDQMRGYLALIESLDEKWAGFRGLVNYRLVNANNHNKMLFLSIFIKPKIGDIEL